MEGRHFGGTSSGVAGGGSASGASSGRHFGGTTGGSGNGGSASVASPGRHFGGATGGSGKGGPASGASSGRHFGGATGGSGKGGSASGASPGRHFGGTTSGSGKGGSVSGPQGRHFGGPSGSSGNGGSSRKVSGGAEGRRFGAGGRVVRNTGSTAGHKLAGGRGLGGGAGHPASASNPPAVGGRRLGGTPRTPGGAQLASHGPKIGGRPAAIPRGGARLAATKAKSSAAAHTRPPHSANGRSYVYNGESHPSLAAGNYDWPSGEGYQSLSVGDYLPPSFWSPDYFVEDYSYYGIAAPAPDYGWVRYGPDLVLIQLDTGAIAQEVPGVFEEAGDAAPSVGRSPSYAPTGAYSGDPDELPGDPPPPGGGL
ncbi:MAG TPA: RcnB family protein [Caulobacteraceae bacterium]